MKTVTMAKPRDPLRRLVLVPDLAPQESFHSWTSRISELHQCKQTGIGPYLGLTFHIGPYSRGLPREELEVLQTATGMPPQQHPEMTLASYGTGHTRYGWIKMTEKSPWFWRVYTTSVCPACLDCEDCPWKITWQLVPIVACPIHRIFLQGVCPVCREPIPIGIHPDYRRCCSGPYQHFELGQGPPDTCHHSLASLPRHPVHDEKVFELQDLLVARLRCTPTPANTRFWNAYYLLFRKVLCLGTPDMIPNSDFWLMRRWHQYCSWRDRVSTHDPDTAEAWLGGVGRAAPGPMLTAAIMLIIEEMCRTRTVAAERAFAKGPWNAEAARRDWVTVRRRGILAPRPTTMINNDTQVNETLEWPLIDYSLLAIGEGHLHPALEANPSDFDAVRPWTPRRYFRELAAQNEIDLGRNPDGAD